VKRDLIANSFCLLVTCMIPMLSARAIECLSAPKSGSGWWSWREIDGRKCWYKKVGAVPPKSECFWPEQAKEAPTAVERVLPAEERVQQEPLPMPAAEPTTATVPKVKMVRVKSVDLSNPVFRLSNGLIDLTKGLSLAGFHGVGGAWQTPPYISADAFDARFGQW
jgi:hypothetical protein